MITENLQRLLNECIMIEDGNYLGGKFSVNLKDCQNELDEIKQNSHKQVVMQAEGSDGVKEATVASEGQGEANTCADFFCMLGSCKTQCGYCKGDDHGK